MACLNQRPTDSQSAVGILQLGWKADTYTTTVRETKQMMKDLDSVGIKTDISWTPGHANILGNEIADRLAKEAASEAEKMGESNIPTTLQDIKKAAKKSCEMKWQNRWQLTDTGRHLHQYMPNVGLKLKVPTNTSIKVQCQRVIHQIQLRTGYCMLNGYMHRIGLAESPVCACQHGAETVQHYLEDCVIHEEARERLRLEEITRYIGVYSFNAELLLQRKKDDPYTEWRLLLNETLCSFISITKRLMNNTASR
ncbi:uncharacterized protein LOC128555451 [Mercenaria mercenaria]|uniref:uncharacterized protein LOC128555451 n=1 Tax=Mercenaria mercenaria TaxID=6596 RepID=UPI00234EA0EC|nr:uncharacterized protein LOC128555451 [Mercenaria mercenaria]